MRGKVAHIDVTPVGGDKIGLIWFP